MCSICFEDFKPYDDLYSTHCGHVYHFLCMLQWQSRSSCCPQCHTYKPKTHRIYIELKNMSEYDMQKFNLLEQKLSQSHIEMLKLKEDINNAVSQLRDALTLNAKLQLRLQMLEMKLKVRNKNADNGVNNNNYSSCEYQGEKFEKAMHQRNENDNLHCQNQQKQQQHEQQQLQPQSDEHLKLPLSERVSTWFIRQTNQGNFQLKGPFNTISDGIIAAKKENLIETGLTIDGIDDIDDIAPNAWSNWLRDLQMSFNSVNTTVLEERDIIKTYYIKHARKLFIQFRTSEWRDRFLQINNSIDDSRGRCSKGSDNIWRKPGCNISSLPHIEANTRFTTDILPETLALYDTLFEYAKTLKLAGFKVIYANKGNIFVKRHKNSPSLIVKNKKEVDDLMKGELNL